MTSCKVIYDDVIGDGHSYTSDYVKVRVAEFQKLPSQLPTPRGLNTGELAIPDMNARFTRQVQTKEGAILETYEGAFRNIVGAETYIAFGDRIVMKPGI
jgi:hypothetical protein